MKTAMICLMTAIVLSLLASTALVAGDWSPIYEGIEYQYAEKTSPRLMKAFAIRVDLKNPATSFYTTPSNGSAAYETVMRTVPSFRSTYGLEAAINANYFVSHSPNAEIEGLLISNGTTVSTDQAGRQAQLRITSAKIASIVGTGGNPSGIHTAVAGDAHHLVNGTCLGANDATAPRTSVGLSQDGRFLIMCVVDGRQPGWSDGATILDMSYWMRDFGAYNAINLDGGGSSTICSASGGVYNRPSDGSPRSVGASLGVNSTSGKAYRMDVVARGTNNVIYHKTWTNAAGWSSWLNRGGETYDDPSAVSNKPGILHLFCRGTNGYLYQLTWNGSWGAWTSRGTSSTIIGGPDACSWNYDCIYVFARSANNTLMQLTWTESGGWATDWVDLGAPTGGITSDPSATCWAPGRIDVFARGSNGHLWHRTYNSGTGWSSWYDRGGDLIGAPDACAWDSERLDIFWRGTDNTLRHKCWTPDGWGPEENHGGVLYGSPGAASFKPNRVDCFITGGSNVCYQKYWENSWSGWINMGAAITGGPDACSWTNDAGTHQ